MVPAFAGTTRDERWHLPAIAPTLPLRSCVARQEPYIPGALSILPGTVPGQVRGPGHMVPTYFRRELRDRVLQRRPRLRAFHWMLSSGPALSRPSTSVPRPKKDVDARHKAGHDGECVMPACAT